MSVSTTAPAEMPATEHTPAEDSAANTPAVLRAANQGGWAEEIYAPAQVYNANVPMDAIERDPGNRVPTKEAVQALAETIRIEGLLQPITLRDLGGGRYRIIAGETRWRAFELLKRATIPAMIRPVEERAEAGPSEGDVAKRLVENLTRTDLNPVDQARGFKQLTELGRTQKQVGALFGLSQPVVANSLRMLALPPDVLDMIAAGKLSAAHGVSLARFAKFPKIVTAIAEELDGPQGRFHTAKDLARNDVPFAHMLIRAGYVVDIRTRGSWSGAKDPVYVVPEALLACDEFVEADHCVYYLREPGTVDLWAPEKAKQDAAREAREKKAKAKDATGGKTREQLERANKIKANRQLRADIERAFDDGIDALKAAKDLTPDMVLVLIEEAMANNNNANCLEEAEGRDVESFLRERTVEQHYSADALAELIEVSPRTVWSWIERYEASAGKEGLGPVVKLSHKNVRIPASAVNRMLAAHTVDAVALAGGKAAA